MALIVQKYGGSSVGNIERMKQVGAKVMHAVKQGHQVVVVLSAMQGETDRIIHLLTDIHRQYSEREYAVAVSTGEQVSVALMASYLQANGFPAQSLTGAQAGILTDTAYTKARILDIDPAAIKALLAQGVIPVVAGFQGKNALGEVTTLGRGGSDTTGVALAAALQADECQIYTDVEGVYTADPRIVSDARLLTHITFDEMLELASLGAKVLQKRSVELVGKYKVNLRVLSTFREGQGTLITYEESRMEQPLVSGIAYNLQEAKLTLRGVPDIPGVAAEILKPMSDAQIDIDMIIQNASLEGTTDFSFTVNREDYVRTFKLLEEIAKKLEAKEVRGDQKIAKISLVGVGMRTHAGIAQKMFKVLGEEGINIQLISTSEIKISVVIDEKYLELAVRALHAGFELATVRVQEEFDPVVI
jgi:aspartate kinase